MRRRQNGRELVYNDPVDGPHHQPLFSPPPPVPVPAQRGTGWAVITAVLLTLLIVGLGGVFGLAYYTKLSELADVKQEHSELLRERGTLRSSLAVAQDELRDTRGRLIRANMKLTNTTKNLNAAKRNMTKMRDQLTVANERAAANYSTGYNAGNSTGYSTGRDAGLVAGSDELTCSDDPDVTWLPYCR